MTTVPRRAEITARVFFTLLAVLNIASMVMLIAKGVQTGKLELGLLLLLASFTLIMIQEAWARRFEVLAITAASPQRERDERRRTLAAKSKAIAGGSALVAGIALALVASNFQGVAEAFEGIGAVQSVQATVGLMAFCYFLGRLMIALILNRRE